MEGWRESLVGEQDEWLASSWNFSNWYRTPRGLLVLLGQHVPAMDTKWTGISRKMDPDLWDYFEAENMTAPKVKLSEQLIYKFGINIEGTGTGDRIYWQMMGGQARDPKCLRVVHTSNFIPTTPIPIQLPSPFPLSCPFDYPSRGKQEP